MILGGQLADWLRNTGTSTVEVRKVFTIGGTFIIFMIIFDDDDDDDYSKFRFDLRGYSR
jgi:hypothetical protein